MSLQIPQEIRPVDLRPSWRAQFKTKSEMDSSPIEFPISDFLPEGITFIGGLSGSGKTWLGLSMAKAICAGEAFLGRFAVNERSNVLYLVPESGERAFRERMEIMGIPDDESFLCRTMSDGPMDLDNPDLESAVFDLNPVVFLDTLIRFSDTDNENDASQSARVLAKAIFALIASGAKAVVCLHHSTKVSGSQVVTLENTLRGSGDLGAMADAVYSLRVQDSNLLRIRVQSVKTRDFEPVKPFVIQGRPHLNESGDFQLLTDVMVHQDKDREGEKEKRFLRAIEDDPKASYRQLATKLDTSLSDVQRIANRLGWKKGAGTEWVNKRVGLEVGSAAA